MASAPFPIPAHRTGRAELPHPALRLASPQGPRRGSSRQAHQAEHTAFTMDHTEGEPPIAASLHLVPPGEECAYALGDVVIDAAECRTARPVAEVVRPAAQRPVQ